MSATSIETRWKLHLKNLRNGSHHCLALKRAYKKYGEEKLVFEVLEIVEPNTDVKILLNKEQQWWDFFNNQGAQLYNGRPTGTGSVLHTEETKARISAALTKPKFYKSCKECSVEFIPKRKTYTYCSATCSNKQMSDEVRNLIPKMYLEEFLSLRVIAKKLDISHITVRQVLLKEGIEIRNPNKK